MLESMTDEELLHLKYILQSSEMSSRTSKRTRDINDAGFDLKWAYHIVRLLNEVEQIMVEGDLDLERNREQLKAIRRGEWTLEELQKYFEKKESSLEETYSNSTLPHGPDQECIKQLLMECLEMHYGNLDNAVVRNPSMDRLLDDLRTIVDRHDTKQLPVLSKGTPYEDHVDNVVRSVPRRWFASIAALADKLGTYSRL